MRQDPVARFWSKVDVRGPDECWPWLAAVDGDGYGRFSHGGRGAPQARASRFAYACEHGPIPEGASVLHSCDNPPCCNPRHLRAGTHQDNMEVAVVRGRKPRVRGNARLTPAEVLEIRRSAATGSSLAARFGLAKSTVSMIRSGRTWADV